MPRSSRRATAFLALALPATVALTGCGIVGGEDAPTATPTSTATHTATVTRTPTQTATATPLPTDTPVPVPTDTPAPVPTSPPQASQPPAQQPPASVNGRPLPQGGTLVIRTAGNGAASASLAYRGGVFPMVRDGDAFWTVIPAGATATLGDSEAVTTLFDNAGQEAGTASELVSVVPTNWYVENIDLPPGVGVGIPPEDIQAEINIRAATFANFTFEKLWSGPFIYPVNGPITANFGDARSFNGGPVGNHHTGTDFGVEAGTPIGAAAHGRVVFTGNLATHGNSVIVDHGVGVFTTYNHMSQINAVVGQEVQPGDVVGLVGTTGLSTGPHLHWELVVGGIPVNPLAWTQPGGAP